ncbi:ABC transporter permease [Nocardiopsis changdeensis]|uniref:Iron ABC transporter permease n=1 Tax=Nocardiopsis changdeensis TaxID=2831969 RepID=A0ABX8BXL0_9ACTN|nr:MULTISPECIES: iron ABC transporter permease [Nocardiopsis]QUX25073.1 iron ABC transporter permease [Nocardiopsis changdeensis]QYX35459.1 iron ABC transporter permease [Nocardiopsis sp. MT53]
MPTAPSPRRTAAGRAAARARSALTRPTAVLGACTLLVLAVLVVAPLAGLVNTTLTQDGRGAWTDVFASPMSENLLWRPMGNSILVGAATAVGSTVIGGFLAWVVVMTRIPGRGVLGLLATIPFALPSFALALAWESVFRNDLIGGSAGILTNLGVAVPDWLAWGPVPVAATLTAHYFSLSFMLIAAALASVNGDLMEAAELTGASTLRVARDIALPVVAPAMVSGALLAFAEGVSNFVTPALLGLPVRFHTLSTRLYGAISTGDVVRGYVLSIVLILVAAMIMYASTRLTGGRRSFATITGKGGRRRSVDLGPWTRPTAALAWLVVVCTTVVPGAVLVLSSLTRRTNDFASGFTLHYWIGASDPAFAQGLPGILGNPQILQATWNTVLLGVCVAVGAGVLGLLVSYAVTRSGGTGWLPPTLGVVSFVPFLIPGIALGAAFIAQFGAPIGPFPSLYGTFAILVLAGIAATIPFAVRSGTSALSQVSRDVEEAAVMAGAGLFRRIGAVIAPLTARGLFTGGVLVFVQMVRDLSLVVLLATPAMPVLAVLTYQYSSENFTQLANAVTVVIAVISVGATVLARRLEGAAQPWNPNP